MTKVGHKPIQPNRASVAWVSTMPAHLGTVASLTFNAACLRYSDAPSRARLAYLITAAKAMLP